MLSDPKIVQKNCIKWRSQILKAHFKDMPTSCPKLLKETEGIEAEYAYSQKKVKRLLIEIKSIWTADFPKQMLLKLNQNLKHYNKKTQKWQKVQGNTSCS